MLFSALRLDAQTRGGPLRAAAGIAFDAAGNLYIADAASHQVWEATLGGALVLIAGTGVQGFAGDGGPATAAELNEPQGLAFGPDGTLYVADTGNQRIRAIGAKGVIATFAGTGAAGFGGDGGAALAALLRGPRAVAVDGAGAVLVCDTGNQRVRRISGGLIATVAGNGVQGFGGDGGAAVAAELDLPSGLGIAPDGRIFVADTHNQRVRVVNTTGDIATMAGTGVQGLSGDGGPSSAASLSLPRALAWTAAGTLLIADEGNQRVRSVDSVGVISTVAGSGVEGASMDGAAALQASMRGLRGLAVSSFGMPVVADSLNGTVRELTGSSTLYRPAGLAPGRSSGVSGQAAAAMGYGSEESVAVTVGGPVNTPQGQVQILEGTTLLGSGTLSGTGTKLGVDGLTAGSHALTVTYLGDGLNPSATSAALSVSVAPLALTATASSAQIAYGLPVPVLSGGLSGVLPIDAGSVQASFGAAAGPTSPVGTYPIVATLSGMAAANYTVSMSSESGSLQVVKGGTQAVLRPAQGFAGMPLSLSATVSSVTSGQPTGTVQFLDGTTIVATAAVQGGQASATYTAPPLGTRNLSVQYLGDNNFLPSLSVVAPVSVGALPDFALAPSGMQSASTAGGGSASFSFVVSAQPGPFTGAIALSATGAPHGSSVSFSPPQVVPGTGSTTVAMTVQTVASSAAVPSGQRPRASGAAVAMAALGLGWIVSRRRRGALPWLLSALVFLAGCGARTVGEGTAGLVSQTYTVQVTGTATNLLGAVVSHATTVTLTVQQ